MSRGVDPIQEKVGGLSEERTKLLELFLRKNVRSTQTLQALPREGGGPWCLPSSTAQERLWFIHELEGGSRGYHIPVAVRIYGTLDADALKAALDGIVQRHETLRTVFTKVDGVVLQVIAPSGAFPLEISDLRSCSVDERESQVLEYSRIDLTTPFDLTSGPLVRARLLQVDADEHALLVTMHHTISDGWSLDVLMRELIALYGGGCHGEDKDLPPLWIQYADYAQWQRTWLQRPELQEHLAYWKDHLLGAPALLELPTDHPRPPTQSYSGATVPVFLDVELTAGLRALARRLNLTLAMVLYGAWSILLSRLSGQKDVVVGMPVANRRRIELESLIGLFVNTLAIRVRLEDDPQVTQFLERMKSTMLGAYAHEEAPFEHVVEALKPPRTLSYGPIFQAMLALRSATYERRTLPGLTFIEQSVPLHATQFDVNLSLQESSTTINGGLTYATDLFDAATVERWVSSFDVVLRSLARAPDQRISALPVMTESELERVVRSFNSTEHSYEADKLIHELIERQVARTPEATAAKYEDEVITYAELDGRANQLAAFLRELGVGPDRLVGICVERSIEMVVGLLGILKAGGAYVPLDPSYPPDRLAYMLEDAAPQVLLIQERLQARLPHSSATVVALDRDWHLIAQHSTRAADVRALGQHSAQLAYVIYTSGSTGRPKGAMNEHRALINRLQWMQREYELTERDCVLQKTPFSFDVSVWEFFWTLMSGAQLVIARPEGHKDPDYLRELIEARGVTRLHFVPSMLQAFLEGHTPSRCRSIDHVVCSGEELSAALRDKCFECFPHARLSNLYGPTEAAVDVTAWECRPQTQDSRVPIGRPIANTQIYVLDLHLQPVPIGVAGEIHIGGVQVGRGYLNRPELTRERFIPDPFRSEPEARLYKTGDLGRWRADGTVEYLGRNDHQVKIRGFRIELGEIEVRLLSHSEVREAAVVAREDVPGDKRLIAYVVHQDSHNERRRFDAESLRSHLRATLPEYMIPSAFVCLERMPLSPNGKLDRRALPVPQDVGYSHRGYEAPQGEIEEILAGIWQGLLRTERVGRHDNFFELGGHSLMIVHMLERLRRVGLSTEVRRVYESETLANLAAVLTTSHSSSRVSPNLIPEDCEVITPQMLTLIELRTEHLETIVQAVPGGAHNIQDIYPLAPLQEGILFHHLLSHEGGDTYVVPTLLSVSSRERLDQLLEALQGSVDRHDALRTAILWESLPQPVQVVYRRAALPVEIATLDPDRDPRDQVRDWMKPSRQRIDLRQAPLFRVKAAEDFRSGGWYVLLQMHHVIGDNTSRDIVTSEAVAHLEGRAEQLPPAVPYREHVAHALAYAHTPEVEAFFTRKLGDVDEPTAPFGLLDVHSADTELEEAGAELELHASHRLRAQARRLGVSGATLFHAAWGLVVAHASGRDDVVFGTVLLGRLQSSVGAQRVLGMFINTLPVRLQLRELSAGELVERTQRELIELLAHEQAPLSIAQRCSGVESSAPLFTALFNYRHGVPRGAVQWDDAEGVREIESRDRTNYPIAFSIDDTGDTFGLVAQTDRRIDPRRVLGYMRQAVHSLLDALESRPDARALTLPILPAEERSQVLELFNATRVRYPHHKPIHELFEEQVERAPHAPAAVSQDQVLTYLELNAKANQLARYLTARGVSVGDCVPVHMSRSLQMLAAQVAVLKCGAAYLPIDPELPAERRAFMIDDCRARHVLVQGRGPADLQSASLVWVDCTSPEIEGHSAENPGLPVEPMSAAYVMYTSGSTGVPKGVIVPHRGIARLVINNGFVDIVPDDCVAHYSNPAFDASTLEIWGALLNGARVVVIPPPLVLDAGRFADALAGHGVTTLYMSVGLFNQYTQALARVFAELRHLMIGGEAVEPGAVRRVLCNSPPRRMLNVYGPTECTTISTSYLIEEVEEGTKSLPIGRPISNTRIYILDAQRQPVPIGVAGEIYIGGDGVACGYLNRPELTAERFVPDPFSSDRDARLYKTGDLGRWRGDGVLEFLGRNDHQVKIRGFRIELGEIEAQLRGHAQLQEAVVLAREDTPGQKLLVAYVVPVSASRVPRAEELRTYLRKVLPEYMVPSAFVVLASLPLTSSGKVDRKALPPPYLTAYESADYEPPLGHIEASLVRIYGELLQLPRVGRRDNFFDLGGHSLLALQALVRINETLGTALSITDLYKCPTVQQLAERIRRGARDEELVDLEQEAQLDPAIVAHSGTRRVPAAAVLLTGATGFVGRFLLMQLLEDTGADIYCLIRGSAVSQAHARLQRALSRWDLWRPEYVSRIRAVPGDLRLAQLGLDRPTYDSLCDNVDEVYHCGTSMNHLETYAMAKAANVDSARELLGLASTGRPKLVNYISTLGVFSYSTSDDPRVVDESTPIEAEKHSTHSGYLASKWVAEKIFMTAVERGIPCNIFRLGLVWADARAGRYDELQHVYRLFKSCLLSGRGIKEFRHEMAPTPVDYVARAVVFLARQHPQGGGIFHIAANKQMADGWFERCNDVVGTSLVLLPYYEWIGEIKRLHLAGRSLPIVPLIEFAFSLDEATFEGYRQQACKLRFGCAQTHRELERAGIATPVLDDELLKVCVEGMIATDRELQEPRDDECFALTGDRRGTASSRRDR